MSNFSYSKKFLGVGDVFLRSPDYYKPLLDFLENVMVSESELTKAEREIIASHVSNINGCTFCLNAHRATLEAMNVSNETISTLENGIEIKGIRDELRQLIVFADKLTRTPESISITDIDALKEVGISEQTIEDTINVVSIFNYVNRLTDSFGVKGNPLYFKQVGTSLVKYGYAHLLNKKAA